MVNGPLDLIKPGKVQEKIKVFTVLNNNIYYYLLILIVI